MLRYLYVVPDEFISNGEFYICDASTVPFGSNQLTKAEYFYYPLFDPFWNSVKALGDRFNTQSLICLVVLDMAFI